jgi:hypothetical protein
MLRSLLASPPRHTFVRARAPGPRWPCRRAGTSALIREYCLSCEVCCKTNPSTEKPPLKMIFTRKPRERLIIDMFFFMPTCALTGNTCVLNIVDHFSKYDWAYPFVTKDSEPIAMKICCEVVAQIGDVVYLGCDNGREFVSKAVKVSSINVRPTFGCAPHLRLLASVQLNSWTAIGITLM